MSMVHQYIGLNLKSIGSAAVAAAHSSKYAATATSSLAETVELTQLIKTLTPKGLAVRPLSTSQESYAHDVSAVSTSGALQRKILSVNLTPKGRIACQFV